MTDVALSPLSGCHQGAGPGNADPFFDALFRTYARRVKALGERQLPGRGLGDDVVQETFLRAYRFQAAFDQSRPAWPWLRTIAFNVCADLVRGKAATETPCAEVAESDGIDRRDPIDAVLASERSAVVAAALQAVNPRQRRVLLLRDAEGWENDDVAVLESTTLDAVKSALKRGRQVFREAYLATASERGLLALLPVPWVAAARKSRWARALNASMNVGRVSIGLVPMVAMPAVLGALAVGAALVHVPTQIGGEQPVAAVHADPADVGPIANPADHARALPAPSAGASRVVEARVDAGVDELPVAMSAESTIDTSDRASLIVGVTGALDGAPRNDAQAYAGVPCGGSAFRETSCAALVEALGSL